MTFKLLYVTFVHIWLSDFSYSTYDSWTSTHYIFPFYWEYIITFDMMMWHENCIHIGYYDGTCISYNLTMMTWAWRWGGNSKLSSFLLHLAFLMVDMIYDSYWLCCLSSPSKGSWINNGILWVIMQCLLFVLVHGLIHVSIITLFCYSSPQVFLYALSFLSSLSITFSC